MGTRALLAAVFVLPALAAAGQTAPAPSAAVTDPAATSAPLPVHRVVLYKTGIGYFEHLGRVRDRQDVTIRFTSAQLNDVLKSLTTIDLGRGQVTGISYNSVAPLEQRLGALRLPLDQETTTAGLLGALRGAHVEVTSGGATVAGRLLSAERIVRGTGLDRVELQGISIVTTEGEMRTYELTPGVRVRIAERGLRQELGRYLDIVGSTREQDARSMVISTMGTGDRQLFVSYISEVPIWKSTYRLVLPDDKRKPLLQGWAIVDNTIGEDWKNVELSLVAGSPQSFIQDLSQPYYGRRAVVSMPRNVAMAPQTHQATLQRGTESSVASGYDSARRQAMTRPRAGPEDLESRASNDLLGDGVPGGVVGGLVGGLPELPAPEPPASPAAPMRLGGAYKEAANLAPAAAGARLADLFEYRITQPVTLAKDQSALVPILNAEVTVEKVGLWNRNAGSGRPLRAVWLTNDSPLTLDGGSISIVDANAFAGEGLIEPLKPGERRLVSYAADLGVLVKASPETFPTRVRRVRAHEGILIQDSEDRSTWTYHARSEENAPVTLVIEHSLRPGWTLAEGQSPAETTASAARFRVTLDPHKEASLVVREVHAGETRVSLMDVSDGPWFSQMISSGVSAAELQRALAPLLEKKKALAGFEERLAALAREQQTIDQDQVRLRENMKALRGSTEEKLLLQRYTRQLDEQETRLDTIKQEVAKTTLARDAAAQELSTVIGELSFEFVGTT